MSSGVWSGREAARAQAPWCLVAHTGPYRRGDVVAPRDLALGQDHGQLGLDAPHLVAPQARLLSHQGSRLTAVVPVRPEPPWLEAAEAQDATTADLPRGTHPGIVSPAEAHRLIWRVDRRSCRSCRSSWPPLSQTPGCGSSAWAEGRPPHVRGGPLVPPPAWLPPHEAGASSLSRSRSTRSRSIGDLERSNGVQSSVASPPAAVPV
jgi:hypothetical protein